MRDPNRIYEIMVILQKIWQAQPDTRFNQLIRNLQWEYASNNEKMRSFWEKEEIKDRGIVAYKERNIPELYNVEDDDFLIFLKSKLSEIE